MNYGHGSTEGGVRGDGGSAGAFSGQSGLGLTTGTTWHGTTAFGPAGGMAQGYGTRQSDGTLGNLRGMDGRPYGRSFGMNFGATGQPQGGYKPAAAPPPPRPVQPPRPVTPPPRPVTPRPTVVGPWENVPYVTNPYDALRASYPPGISMGAFGSGYNN